MYKKILVALDGSSTSEAALGEALDLIKDRPAALRLLHVVDSTYAYPDVMYGHQVVGDLEELRQAWHKVGRDILDQAATQARRAGIESEIGLVESNGRRVSDAVLEEARSWGANLIVVGTHGRRGLHRWLLGSVADGVARAASTSVLLVRRSGADTHP